MVRMTVDSPALPELSNLAAYQKLPQKYQSGDDTEGWLDLISENKDDIDEMIESFK